MKLKGNCLIAQSGGPTSVINASLYGVAKELLEVDSSINIYAGIFGVQGILEKKVVNLSKLNKETFEKIRLLPSAAFGSCRYKLSDDLNNEYQELFDIFKEYDIRYFFYIGGNDSMDSAYKISQIAKSIGHEVYVMGVPKTIDNDLCCTDHTPGFGSAAKYIANVTAEVFYDISSYNKKQVVVMEAMGRNAGWITAASSITARLIPSMQHFIYLPEVVFEKEKFLNEVERALKVSKHVVVVASEGIKDKEGTYVTVTESVDSFGHVRLGGVANALRGMIKSSIDTEVRQIELGVMQRCAMHCVSAVDLQESEEIGRQTARFAIQGETGYMAAFSRKDTKHYESEIIKVDLSKVRNEVKYVPDHYIGKDGVSVTDECIEYIKPLISGKVDVFDESGLIQCVDIHNLRADLK